MSINMLYIKIFFRQMFVFFRIMIIKYLSGLRGLCHHSMECPRVANGETASRYGG
jgi:hypothetical protein